MIEAAGFEDVMISEAVDVFEGASGEANARAFEVYGYTFRAVKAREVEQVEPMAAACTI